MDTITKTAICKTARRGRLCDCDQGGTDCWRRCGSWPAALRGLPASFVVVPARLRFHILSDGLLSCLRGFGALQGGQRLARPPFCYWLAARQWPRHRNTVSKHRRKQKQVRPLLEPSAPLDRRALASPTTRRMHRGPCSIHKSQQFAQTGVPLHPCCQAGRSATAAAAATPACSSVPLLPAGCDALLVRMGRSTCLSAFSSTTSPCSRRRGGGAAAAGGRAGIARPAAGAVSAGGLLPSAQRGRPVVLGRL